MSTLTPDLADVIQMFIDLDRASLHTSFPGRVKSYDAAKQVADIEPMIKCVSRNADDERIIDTLPILSAVPVQWTRGGGYFLHMPLVPGDCGLVVVADTDIGAWRDSGQVSDPGDERRHALGGCMFIPGVSPIADNLTSVPTNHLFLGKQGGPAVHVTDTAVELGDTGGEPVALATSLLNWINTVLRPALNAAPGGPIVVAAPSGVAATLTKAK